MARITVTDAAKTLVRELVARHPCIRPVLSVFWAADEKDVRRGPSGEVVWVTISSAGWKAAVLGWEDMPTDFSIRPVPWEELEMSVTSHVKEFPGQLIVDCTDGKLTVHAVAI